MKTYEEIPIEEETEQLLNAIKEAFGLENHNAVINFLIGQYYLRKAREEVE